MEYAYNDMALRRNLWKEIIDIYNHTRGPWAVMRDFNSVIYKEDRVGSPVTMAETRDSRQCFDTCFFQELKSTVMINWDTGNQKTNRPFKYFNIWSLDPEFKARVEDSRKNGIRGTKIYQLVGKLNRLKKLLKLLNRSKFSDIELKTEQAKEELEKCQQQIQQSPISQSLATKEQELKNNYRRAKQAADQFLTQKSKVLWLKHGDQNNRYFHSFMKARRNANKKISIKDSKGRMVTIMEGIA
ncbi:uncharacterized protein [Nicotiana sylvestris]|uniref:uncharacterized protein n=1 Tax=Nicotiana sylvestris TaxID=4096 RepID=UPI00388C6B03